MNRSLTSTLTPAGEMRRLMCASFAVGLAGTDPLPAALAATAVEEALAERFALKRRAYRTGDADMLRSLYANDIGIESLLLQDLSLTPGFAITPSATEKKGAV